MCVVAGQAVRVCGDTATGVAALVLWNMRLPLYSGTVCAYAVRSAGQNSVAIMWALVNGTCT